MYMISIPYYETSFFALSNFSAHRVNYQGKVFPSAEHAYHAQKFEESALQDQIINRGSPLEAWTLAHELKMHRRIDWDDIKIDVLTDIIRHKAQQHQEIRDTLLATGDEEIVEINPNDDFWGNGEDGQGQNHTGKIWMKVREELKH